MKTISAAPATSLAATVLVGAGVALVSCSPHKVTHNPKAPVQLPAAYGSAESKAPMPDRWWRDFGDPELERLVAAALAGNTQMRAAWARVRVSQALARQAGSTKWPQLELKSSASRAQQRFNLPMLGEQKFTSNSFTASVGAGYEVDLWRKLASTASAAELGVLASRDNLETLAVSTVAQVAELWYALVESQATRALLEQQLESSQTYLELTELRFQQGLTPALDVYQQQQVVVGLESQLILADSARQVLSHRLAILTGQPPRAVVATPNKALPELPPIPGIGIPADLLERRPDVRAARRRVEMIDFQVAAAVADRLPGLRLQGMLSLSDSNIKQLLAAPLYSILGSVLAPLFDGGRRKAVVQQRRAEVEEALWNYGTVLLGAMGEVENALVQERQQRLYIAKREQQVDIAARALREARERYRQGLLQYLSVLTSLQAEQRAQQALLGARRQLISYRIQLYRALGGSWTRSLRAPAPRGLK